VTFERRDLDDDVAAVRAAHAPDTLVFDVEQDFETLPPAEAEDLGLVVDALDPLTYPEAWLPPDAPDQLRALAGGTFTVGAPGDGGVAWTRQTDPPVVLVKGRTRESPDDFVAFLVAEALVQVGLAPDGDPVPEHFLGFFEDSYRRIAATDLGPADAYQVAAALYDAWLGLHARETFADWEGDHDRLFAAWVDAGERLEPRLSDLGAEMARGETTFAAATELACAAVKHGVEIPAPFDALDAAAYRSHGAEYGVRWAEKTAESLSG
jgi:hypothetical protein